MNSPVFSSATAASVLLKVFAGFGPFWRMEDTDVGLLLSRFRRDGRHAGPAFLIASIAGHDRARQEQRGSTVSNIWYDLLAWG